ncbi:putative metal dependent phosphohydrolase [Arcobacter nitrofigilis DSM 7299]|uniref:Putative metal dependent phosphohydrolase n=1 Tax=Arcobacter nitrofigilis (strain ATCC 33309 / DSM 7299 / CCUG 15893 / LMG 7604 / NCTC 12251 / CI) TaxID=572480 RepID=D5V1M5_ARCNC|nr:HD domain-containing phosphohydrolase [Arcobacter nitrofigilis]ADG93459.1 putative metal dependent phosphohydrolase [Arcobacter nitrofigilis DSM 7299]
MDKKKELNFNLNNFLLALSFSLDYLRKDKCSSSLNYSKRVTYIALNIGKELQLSPQEMSDLCSFSLVHSVGLMNTSQISKEYCESSNDIVSTLPFLDGSKKDILKYQNEYYDGSGFFGLKAEEIPLFSQLLSISIAIENRFNLSTITVKDRTNVISFIENSKNELFSDNLADIFLKVSQKTSFWLDLQNETEILYFIFGSLHDFTITLAFEKLFQITSSLYLINNVDSKLLVNLEKIMDFYNFEHKDKFTLLIAASLCNIGKSCIPSSIINKKTKLETWEYEEIKSYPYYTKKVLSNIMGFDDISSWASKVQEKPNGKGYPFCLKGKDLSLKDRLLAVVNSFSALSSTKSYRKAYNKAEAIKILKDSAQKDDSYDLSIIEDLEKVL